MIRSKKSIFFYLCSFMTICCIVALTFTACNQGEDATPKPQAPAPEQDSEILTLREVTPITESSSFIIALKKTKDIRNLSKTLGTPDWTQANLATYENTEVKAIIVPLSSGKMLMAYTIPNVKEFKVLVLEIAADNNKMSNAREGEYSGEINFYLSSGELLQGATYEDDKLIASQEIDASALRTNVNWSCFGDCIKNEWRNVPWRTRIVCGVSLAACVARVAPACIRLAACIGGYAGTCLRRCW